MPLNPHPVPHEFRILTHDRLLASRPTEARLTAWLVPLSHSPEKLASKISSVVDSDLNLPEVETSRPGVIRLFAALMAAVVVYGMFLEAKMLSNHMDLSACLLQTFFVAVYGYETAF